MTAVEKRIIDFITENPRQNFITIMQNVEGTGNEVLDGILSLTREGKILKLPLQSTPHVYVMADYPP